MTIRAIPVSEAPASSAVDNAVPTNIASTTTTTPQMRDRASKMRYAKTGVACFFLINGWIRHETYRQIKCLRVCGNWELTVFPRVARRQREWPGGLRWFLQVLQWWSQGPLRSALGWRWLCTQSRGCIRSRKRTPSSYLLFSKSKNENRQLT